MLTPIHVVAAIIQNAQREILCARRSFQMTLPGFWEFPGGKVESEETAEVALAREIQEELGCQIAVGAFVENTTHTYGFITIRLETYMATLVEGLPVATEHSELRWVPWQELHALEWAPADIPAVERVIALCKKDCMSS
ncbi:MULTISPECIES: (deoxy)nucleoside triphosphate pyrophosphohydrolase [Sporosarcina]|uniref:(deoxy)nucleoside triphosphate pyrophosphohydrolase n=1 Tax=Sporosarcina TaxID=1569 RepID=UPI00058E5EC3|nr:MULTISPECIES: (deoxy)nucleoside triphosphate pyrophosphohydrolase [Sporosarcina]WJY27528.1 (deoxy)nucleoside triphosphate pyrophosphohydrolase [Sporosarcina sp. 0.2-SM1T-5]